MGKQIKYLAGAAIFVLLIFLVSTINELNALRTVKPEAVFPAVQETIAPVPVAPPVSTAVPAATPKPTPSVKVHNVAIPVEVVQTKAEVQKGLSGRLSLGADKGMLFIFGKPDIYHFWMPNMHFSIDIIWINDGRVVDITPNLPYDPKHAYILYSPSKPAKYVLEVNSGFAEKHGIIIGDAVGIYLK